MKLVRDTSKLQENSQKISDEKAEEAVRTIIQWIGENPEREGLKSTPKRQLSPAISSPQDSPPAPLNKSIKFNLP